MSRARWTIGVLSLVCVALCIVIASLIFWRARDRYEYCTISMRGLLLSGITKPVDFGLTISYDGPGLPCEGSSFPDLLRHLGYSLPKTTATENDLLNCLGSSGWKLVTVVDKSEFKEGEGRDNKQWYFFRKKR